MKTLFVMRGIQGSGKSFLAKSLVKNGQIFSADDYFSIEGKYNWTIEKLSDAHKWNSKRVFQAIKSNISPIVIDNTNITLKDLRRLKNIIVEAQKNNYNIEIVETDTPWRFDVDELCKRNIHNVPRETIKNKVREYVKDVKLKDILN